MTYRRSARPEDFIQRAVFNNIVHRGAKGLVAFHVPNGGKRSPTEAAIFKGLGVLAGVPDIFLFHNGKSFALEIKSDRGKLTMAQINAHAALRAAGVEVCTSYGLNHALITLESWGLLRGKAQIGGRNAALVSSQNQAPSRICGHSGDR